MKSVTYAGLSFDTADAIADALLELAAALGVSERAETIELPVVKADGSTSSVQLVVGPASQFISSPVESEYDDPQSSATVDDLRSRISHLRMPRATAVPESDFDRFDFDPPA